MVDLVQPSVAGPSQLLQLEQNNDPRQRLAQYLAGANKGLGNVTLYNPMQGLAKGLIDALPAIMQYKVGDEYQQRQTALATALANAGEAATTGTKAWTNPDTGEVSGQDMAPGFGAAAATLNASPDPIAKQMAFQYRMQDLATQQAARTALAQALVAKGQAPSFDPVGNITGVQNIAGAVPATREMKQAEAGGTAQGTADVDLTMKPKIEGAVEAAKNAPLIARAGGEAGARKAAELPYVGPTAEAQAAGTGRGELQNANALAAARAAGTAAGELPYVGPKAEAHAGGEAAGRLPYVGPTAQAQSGGTKAGELPYIQPEAAARAAGTFYGAPQKTGPGDTITQIAPPAAPGAAPQTTTVYANPNPSPGTQPGHIDTFLADTFKGHEDTAQKGREKIANMLQLNNMLTGVETGKFAGTTLDMLKTAKAAGLSTEGMNERTAKMEAATSLGRQLALEGRNFPGAVSNYEQQLLQSMAPGIETTQQGRQKLLEIAQGRQQRNEAIAKLGRDYLTNQDNGGRLNIGYLNKLEEYAKANGLTGISSAAAQQAPQITPEQARAELARRGVKLP